MWILITLAAATFQILRTSRQHELRATLSTNAAGYVRFAYGAPGALLLSSVVFIGASRDMPSIPGRFWPTIVAAGVAQIVGTVALLASFKIRDFAIGTVYSKTEVLIVAGLGAIGLGTALEPAGWLGALLVTAGIASLASRGSAATLLRRAGDPAALLGLLAGGLFALTAVGIGGAATSLDGGSSFDRALLTLTVLLVCQATINTVWFLATDPSEITTSVRAWRPALLVGLFSLLGSLGWAWAFTLESAAKVRTLGQVELIIAFVIARVSLGERHSRADYIASTVVLTGILIVTVVG